MAFYLIISHGLIYGYRDGLEEMWDAVTLTWEEAWKDHLAGKLVSSFIDVVIFLFSALKLHYSCSCQGGSRIFPVLRLL